MFGSFFVRFVFNSQHTHSGTHARTHTPHHTEARAHVGTHTHARTHPPPPPPHTHTHTGLGATYGTNSALANSFVVDGGGGSGERRNAVNRFLERNVALNRADPKLCFFVNFGGVFLYIFYFKSFYSPSRQRFCHL